MYLYTSKGYLVCLIRRISTVCTDIAEYDFNGHHGLVKVYDSSKGSYFTVRCKGKYYGRVYF